MNETKKPHSVVVINPCRLVREGLKQLLQRSGCVVQRDASDIDDLLANANAHDQPDLVICSLNLDERAPIELAVTAKVRAAFPEAKLIVLSDVVSSAGVHQAFGASVDGVLSANLADHVLQCSLDLIVLGQTLYPAKLLYAHANGTAVRDAEARNLLEEAHVSHGHDAHARPTPFSWSAENAVTFERSSGPHLSERESQILHGLTLGSSNKMIAREFDISEATVKVHIRAVLRKIRVSNRTQAAIWALNNQPIQHKLNGQRAPMQIAS